MLAYLGLVLGLYVVEISHGVATQNPDEFENVNATGAIFGTAKTVTSNPGPLSKTPKRVTTCGGRLDGFKSSGEFQSPNYPSHYPDNTTCSWVIEAISNQLIYLKFNDFQLEPGQNTLLQSTVSCPYDVLYIYEEVRGSKLAASWRQSWGFYCGNKSPKSQMTRYPGSKLVIYFHSDMSENRRGFSAEYYFHESKQSHARKATPTPDNKNLGSFEIFGNHVFGDNDSERFQNSFTTIVFFLVSIIFFAAIIKCRERLPPSASSSTQSTNVSSSSFMGLWNQRRRTDLGSGELPTLPPTYDEIIKTEADLHQALERIGTTEQELNQQRMLDVEVTYSIMDENNAEPMTSTGGGATLRGETVQEQQDDDISSDSWSQSSEEESLQLPINESDPSSLQTTPSSSSTTTSDSTSTIPNANRPTCCSPLDETANSSVVSTFAS